MSFGDDTLDPSNVPTEVYCIWSHEHRGWWRSGRNGYTDKIADAGRYEERDAIEIVFHHIPPGQEVAVPVRFAEMAWAGLMKDADVLRAAGRA